MYPSTFTRVLQFNMDVLDYSGVHQLEFEMLTNVKGPSLWPMSTAGSALSLSRDAGRRVVEIEPPRETAELMTWVPHGARLYFTREFQAGQGTILALKESWVSCRLWRRTLPTHAVLCDFEWRGQNARWILAVQRLCLVFTTNQIKQLNLKKRS